MKVPISGLREDAGDQERQPSPASRGSCEEEPQEPVDWGQSSRSDGLGASPQMFPSVVFRSGNNGPAVLGGAWGGPSDPSSLSPLGGQTLPWLDVSTMDRDLSDGDSKYSLSGRGAPPSVGG